MGRLFLALSFIMFSGIGNSLENAKDLVLETVQSLPTSGARSTTHFTIDGTHFLAVTQLAEDMPNTPANLDGGNSDVDSIIYRWQKSAFVEYQRIPFHGGEGSEYFEINKRRFLALASVRSGSDPYNMNSYSTIYEWDGIKFFPIQNLPITAAKGCRHFVLGKDHFLAVAVGAFSPSAQIEESTSSRVYRWNGSRFEFFQTLPSRMAFDTKFFEIDGKKILGLADSGGETSLYQWNGKNFEKFQSFPGNGIRELEYFTFDKRHYLALANLQNPSVIYVWKDGEFTPAQTLEGPGAHNFVFFKRAEGNYLARINFILGTKDTPKTDLTSQIYKWDKNKFNVAFEFSTFGGDDANYFEIGNESYLAVANSLSKDVRFRTDSKIYRVH